METLGDEIGIADQLKSETELDMGASCSHKSVILLDQRKKEAELIRCNFQYNDSYQIGGNPRSSSFNPKQDKSNSNRITEVQKNSQFEENSNDNPIEQTIVKPNNELQKLKKGKRNC
jgi:hypothetical protein